MYRVRKVRSFTKYSCLLAAAVTLFPLSLTPKDFRSSFSEGLAISADKTSPAYAAFEALRENFDGPELQIPLSGERLSTGQVFEMPAGAESQPSRLLSLQGMVIRQTDVIETRSATLIAANTNSATTRQPLMGGLHDDRGYLRPLSERRELLLSKLKTQNEMWAQPSPSELARQ